jgi:hypothetical protein
MVMSDHDDGPSPEDLETYDLNEDGKISLLEVIRERLGAIDAGLEQRSRQPGLRGKIAGALHRIVDKTDNDG